jgi:hypothetical protein
MNSTKMQIESNQINQSISINHRIIAENFLKEFCTKLNFGIHFIDSFFDSKTLCSLYIYQNFVSTDLTETVGYTNLKSKFENIGIKTFKYNNFVQTSQPIGDNLIVTVIGQGIINEQVRNIQSVFVLKPILSTYLIINYILQIFI